MDPKLSEWIKSTVREYGLPSEDHFIHLCRNEYGRDGVRGAREKMEAVADSAPGPVPAIRLGEKPSQEEKIIVKRLVNDIFIRIWGDNLRDIHAFSFDFINSHGDHVRAPPAIKIFILDDFLSDDPEVHSIETALKLADNPNSHAGGLLDPEWETFVVEEGARLRITYPDSPDCYLNVPYHHPQDGDVIVIPAPAFWSV